MKHFLESAPASATWAGLRHIEENQKVCVYVEGKPKTNAYAQDRGIMVEVLVNGHFGYAGTADLSAAGVKQAWSIALQMAESGAAHAVAKFSPAQRPNTKGQFRSSVKQDFSTWSFSQINDLLQLTSRTLKTSEKIVSTSAHVWLTERKETLLSTSGRESFQHFHYLSASFQATASNGHETQTRSDTLGLTKQYGLEVLVPELILENCRKTSAQALELAAAENCVSETLDLVLSPDQMMLQIHESIGHPLELDRILGDERNYAGWSFVKPEDFGNLQYGSKLMNASFAPEETGEFASSAFDESGAPARKEFLIEAGKLRRGLGGLESQFRSGLPGVANARSTSWNRAPIDRMANLNLEPGSSSERDLLQLVERGIWMETNRSWSIDDYRNKFQFGCEYARLIENGKLTKVLKNPNYRGITVPFWNSLKAVGDKSTTSVHGTANCGKGEPNQSIRVGHASPTCLFSNVEVFGG